MSKLAVQALLHVRESRKRHQRFAVLHWIDCKTKTDAYLLTYGGTNRRAAAAAASRLSKRPDVRAFVKELHRRQDEEEQQRAEARRKAEFAAWVAESFAGT